MSAHGDDDRGVAEIDAALAISDEAGVSGHPSDHASDDPAARLDLQAFLAMGPADDLEDGGGIGSPVHKLQGPQPAISEQACHIGPPALDRVEHGLESGAVRDVA